MMPIRHPLLLVLSSVGLFLSASPTHGQISPEAELATLRAAEGIEVSLFASEPLITNPAAIDVDTHGRVWVAEIQHYRRKGLDKIKVLQDTDGDGKADKVTVFADDLFAPMSICVAGEKVYVATSPDLWVYEDKDGDLKADGPPTKLLTGFGGHNHDHGAHSLVLGPDHKWWMSHGDGGFDVEGTDGRRAESRWGAVLRGELDGSRLQVVAHNFRNPYEVCINSFGEAFLSDNDDDGNESVRICWIMEGGNYGWYGRPPFAKNELDARLPAGTPFREHWHFRGHIPGHVPATFRTGFGSPTGICFYESAAFGPHFKNAPLHTDAGPRVVRMHRHLPAGAGMTAGSEVLLTSQGDDYFRPDDICTAPDGSLYVSDWYDANVGGHNFNNPDQGRIFLLRPQGAALKRHEKPGPYDNIPDAIEGLKSPNLATQYLARRRLLAEGQRSLPALESLSRDGEANFRARALWVADRIGGEARRLVLDQLDSDEAAFRALAVRILRRHGEQYAESMLALAGDGSAEVRREVLLATPALQGESALDAMTKIAATYDGTDRYLLEAIHIAAGDRKTELYRRLTKSGKLSASQFSLLELLDPKAAADAVVDRLKQPNLDRQSAAALVAVAGRIASVDAGRSLLAMVADADAAVGVRRMAIDTLAVNLSENWQELGRDERLLGTFKNLVDDAELGPSILSAIGQGGLSELSGPVLVLAADTDADPALRRQAIEVVVRLRGEKTAGVLRPLLTDAEDDVRMAAIGGLVELQDVKTLREVLTDAQRYESGLRLAAVGQLMRSTGGALVLLRLIDEGRLSPEVKARVLAKADRHPDANVRVLYEKFIPPEQRPKRLGEAIQPAEILALDGDAKRGESIFFQSSAAQCSKCHAVGGKGSNIGPDLSMIGKKYAPKALLQTILNPSEAIAPEYQPYVLETEDGRVYAGFLVDQTDDYVVLKDVRGTALRVAAREVVVLERQAKSLMPELVLRDVTAQDAADLLAYLSTLTSGTQPVMAYRILGPLPAGDGLETPLPPERNLAGVDLSRTYTGAGGKTIGWEAAAAGVARGFTAVDTVKHARSQGLPGEQVVHYLLVYADSLLPQEVRLLVRSNDGCKVWVNGQLVHRHDVLRSLSSGQDTVAAKLKRGRNEIVLKVVNADGPGGAALAVRSSEPVDLKAR